MHQRCQLLDLIEPTLDVCKPLNCQVGTMHQIRAGHRKTDQIANLSGKTQTLKKWNSVEPECRF
jgi:hypothetical protein